MDEPDPTTPDPVAYVKAWINYARERLRERHIIQIVTDKEVKTYN